MHGDLGRSVGGGAGFIDQDGPLLIQAGYVIEPAGTRLGTLAELTTYAYRILALLIPMPVSLAALPTLRQMAQRPASQVKCQ